MNTAGFKDLHDIQQLNATVRDRNIVDAVGRIGIAFGRQAARTIPGTVFRTYKRTELPRIGFRAANDGVAPSKASYKVENHECFILDGVIKADEKVLQSSTDPVALVMSEMQVANAEGLMLALEHQLFYGTDYDPLGFPGFRNLIADYMTISADPEKNVDNATNRADNSGASAWLVVERAEYCGLVFGNGAGIKWSPWTRQYVQGNNNLEMAAQVCDVGAWIGFYSKSPFALVRIKNLTAQNPLTDALIQKALEAFPTAMPTTLYTTKRQVSLLQDSRTNKMVVVNNYNGGQSTNAPVPVSYQGWLPIIGTDGLLDDESAANVKALAAKTSFKAIKQTILQR